MYYLINKSGRPVYVSYDLVSPPWKNSYISIDALHVENDGINGNNKKTLSRIIDKLQKNTLIKIYIKNENTNINEILLSINKIINDQNKSSYFVIHVDNENIKYNLKMSITNDNIIFTNNTVEYDKFIII